MKTTRRGWQIRNGTVELRYHLVQWFLFEFAENDAYWLNLAVKGDFIAQSRSNETATINLKYLKVFLLH